MTPRIPAPPDAVRTRFGDVLPSGGRALMRVWPGAPHPLGATWDGEGVNFAIFSEHASSVELCLFEHSDDGKPFATIAMPLATDRVWHCYLPDARPGMLYGYRIDGPWAPDEGHRFNRSKLLLDPYTKAISGSIRWSDELFGYTIGDPAEDLAIDTRDSAADMPKCLVVDQAFTWGDDRPPRTPWNRTIIYETHVRGMTMRHPGVPEHLRGTYLGLSSDAVIDHLLSLGVTAVELMPVHQYVEDRRLVAQGLTNYWGYNSIGFFAPHVAYATGGLGQQVSEFKSMVKTLHRAGLEVILDVVYNHTGEGNHRGPTLSLRGIDNSVYYRLDPERRRFNVDFTGTGNSLNIVHPRAMALIMDSLRYWVTDMHVDGFRFDLAPVLIRGLEDGHSSAFFEVIQQDPVLSQVKLIAEPWDVGPGGYQLGQFPPGWAEWNGAFRDCVRRFWRGDPGQVPELASRLAGSSDIYRRERTAHLRERQLRHLSRRLHADRPRPLRATPQRGQRRGQPGRGAGELQPQLGGRGAHRVGAHPAHCASGSRGTCWPRLFFSQGVRMLLGGDEFGRTQEGNNNAYCQDNPVSWFDWDLDDADADQIGFVRRLISVVNANPILRRRDFLAGTPQGSGGMKDVTWIRPDGREQTEEDWRDPEGRSIGMLLLGGAADEVDQRGRRQSGETLLLLLNGGTRSRPYALPRVDEPGVWEELLNTARPGTRLVRGGTVNLTAHSCILMRHTREWLG